MLSNAYFLAKFRFDTAENEPAKNLQKFANFARTSRLRVTGVWIGVGFGGDVRVRDGARPLTPGAYVGCAG